MKCLELVVGALSLNLQPLAVEMQLATQIDFLPILFEY
jgi:hypothetical protein